MLSVTRDLMLPTAITGSYPRPHWFNESLRGRSFKSALGDSLFREQYLDAVACVINAQEAAGLDIVTDGDSRFDLAVGGKSWFFYPIERLGGADGHRDTARGWIQRPRLRPGRIPSGGQEAYQPRRLNGQLNGRPRGVLASRFRAVGGGCRGRDGGAHRVGEPDPGVRVGGPAELGARAAVPAPARRRRDHVRVRQHGREGPAPLRQVPHRQEDRDRRR